MFANQGFQEGIDRAFSHIVFFANFDGIGAFKGRGQFIKESFFVAAPKVNCRSSLLREGMKHYQAVFEQGIGNSQRRGKVVIGACNVNVTLV